MSSQGQFASIATPPGNPIFVTLDEKYKCRVCQNVCREAMQTACGHRLCESCVQVLFHNVPEDESVACPAREEDCLPLYKKETLPDPSGRREIRRLKVYCDFKSLGCEKTLPWTNLEEHKRTCEYRAVECPFRQYGCDRQSPIPFLELKTHINECRFKPTPCQYCEESIPAAHHEDHYRNNCPAVPVDCPYHCGVDQMVREKMQRHLDLCPNKPTECKFRSVGCNYVGTEREVAQHMLNDTSRHLEQVTVFTASMDVSSMELRNQLQEVTAERNALRQEVGQLKQEVESQKVQLEAQKNATKELKMKMVSLTERTIRMERKSEDMAKKDVVDRHDREVRALQATLTQVKQKVDQGDTRRPADTRGGDQGSGGRFQDSSAISTKVDMHDQQFAQLDVQLAELDLRFQVLETASYDGTLLWKLRDYTRRKQEAVSGKTLSLYSQPFYSHRYGYKMCARVYLNGDGMGKGSHMSLFFVLMRGEYDNLLQWPFNCKVSMILLDQESGQNNMSDTFRPDPSSSSFRKPTSEMNIASGCPLFVAHNVLETRKYIQDDTLFIKFQVDVSSVQHP